MAFRSMKRAKTRLASPWNAKLINEFTPVQENSNEDELAGPSAWLPDPSEHRGSGSSRVCSDPGALRRYRDRGDHLKRGHHASAAALGRAGGGRGTARGSCRPDARPG